MSQLTSTFTGDIKIPPGGKDHANGNSFGTAALNTPADGDVIKPVFYSPEDSLKANAGPLTTPMGTAIPNVGGGFKS